MINIESEINWRDYNYLIEKLTRYEDIGYDVYLSISTIAAPGFVTLYCYRTNINYIKGNVVISELYYDGLKRNGFYYIISITKDSVYQFSKIYELFKLISNRFKMSETNRGTGELIIRSI